MTDAYEALTAKLAAADPEIERLIEAEGRRESEKIRLIASENYVSEAVMEATGSLLTNKYSEGYAASVTTKASRSSTRSRSSRSPAPRSCSASSTPMCSPIREVPRTSPSTWRF